MFVSLGVAAAVLGAAAYLFATRGAAPQRAGDLSASAPPKAQPSEPPGATAAVTAPPLPTSAPTPAAVDVRPPTTEAVVAARPAAPVSNVPTGPVVAPLPSTGRAAAHREGGSKAAGLPEPPLPRIKTIRLDAVTRDIEAKASKRVDDATRVQVKQTFKQP